MFSELRSRRKMGLPGAYDHEPDLVGAPEWARAIRVSEGRPHPPAESDWGVVAASVGVGLSLKLGQEGVAGRRLRMSLEKRVSCRLAPEGETGP